MKHFKWLCVSCQRMKRAGEIVTIGVLLMMFAATQAQPTDLRAALAEKDSLEQLLQKAEERVDELKLEGIVSDLQNYGLPKSPLNGEVVTHSAMILEYSEEHEQAAWVYHSILPDIKEGTEGRTNDFRTDDKVSTGTAVQEDYFLVEEKDGEKEYDGFGYDRGHLAPSADFRWSAEALSESYYYSNMTPQLPGFNREGWVAIENQLRAYVLRTDRALLVVTGGVLHDDLPVQERSVNKVSIPEYYYKVAVDPETKKGIGFIVPHEEHLRSPDSYAVSIDSVESFSGIDFFTLLPEQEKVESQYDATYWFPELKQNAKMLDPLKLPKNTFNSAQAKYQVNSGKKVNVCGNVVEASKSRNGHIFLKFDRVYPETVFQVFISADNLVNFEYLPEEELGDQCLCVKGKVGELGETPTMFIESDKVIMGCDIFQ